MKKRSRKKKHHYMGLTFVILFTGMLCACGDKKPVDILGEETSGEEKGSLKEQMNIPDEKEFTYLNEQGIEKTVVADVVMPDAASAGIYKLEAVDFTTVYMEEVCKAIFDNGKYEIIWPSYIYSKEELQERFDTISEEVAAWTEDSFQSRFTWRDWSALSNMLNDYQDDWASSVVLNPGNDLVLYPAPIIRDPMYELTPGEYYYNPLANPPANVSAEGEIDGRRARVSFLQADGSSLYRHIRLDFDRDDRVYYSEYSKARADLLPTSFVQTEEDAAQMAAGYVEKFGLSEMKLLNTSYVMEYDENFSSGIGEMDSLSIYRFRFGLCKNDVSMLYDVYYGFGEYQATVSVDIGPAGLERIYIRTPYRIAFNLTEESELLNFEHVCDVIETQMAQEPYRYAFSDSSDMSDQIMFGYAIVEYEEDAVLVPAWAYVYDYGGVFEQTFFIINAVDGSIIEPVYEEELETVFYY